MRRPFNIFHAQNQQHLDELGIWLQLAYVEGFRKWFAYRITVEREAAACHDGID